MKDKIVVIGGSGFVGSFLISELANYDVTNIDKNKSPFFDSITTIGNIRNKEDIIFHPKTTTVILLAAEHRDDVSPVSEYYETNVRGTKNVLDKMDELGVKNLIFTSSVAVYGLNKKNPDENHNIDPFNHYGKSKWQAEETINEWFNSDPSSKTVTIIRPTVIFGERNRGNVYNLLKQISSGRFLMIGSGQNKKSMAYVGNIVSFIRNRIESEIEGFHIYNYVDKPDFTMVELLKQVGESLKIKIPRLRIPVFIGMIIGYIFDFFSFLMRKKFAVSSVRIKKFCATTQFESRKAQNVFSAPYSLKEGLDKTLKFEFVDRKESDDEILFFSE